MGFEIKGFTPQALAKIRAFYASRPGFEMEQIAEISLEGPGGEMVEVVAAKCQKCGFTLTPADNPMLESGRQWPLSLFSATRFRHAYDQRTRSVYCGGEVRFETRAIAGVN